MKIKEQIINKKLVGSFYCEWCNNEFDAEINKSESRPVGVEARREMSRRHISSMVYCDKCTRVISQKKFGPRVQHIFNKRQLRGMGKK